MQAKDWRGTEIKVGSTVVYPSRQSSFVWMSEGEVVSVQDGRVGVRRTRTTGYNDGEAQRTSYPDPSRITVVA